MDLATAVPQLARARLSVASSRMKVLRFSTVRIQPLRLTTHISVRGKPTGCDLVCTLFGLSSADNLWSHSFFLCRSNETLNC